MRKLVFGVYDQVRLKPACSATETSCKLEISDIKPRGFILSRPAERGSSIGCASARYADGRGFDPHIRQHSFVEFGHEIISTAILSLPLIQEGQLSGTGERMCTKYW